MIRYKVTLLLLVMVVATGIMELSFRILEHLRQNPELQSTSNGLSILPPQINGKYFSNESGHMVRIETNALGYMDPTPQDITTDKPIIAVLGDSFVEARQVDADKNFTALLNATSSPISAKYTLLNFGSAGEGEVQEIARYALHIRPLHPVLVVLVLYEGNDFSDNAAFENTDIAMEPLPASAWPNYFPTSTPTANVAASPLRQLLLHSSAIRFLRDAVRNDPHVSDLLVRLHILRDIPSPDLQKLLPYLTPSSTEGIKDLAFTADMIDRLNTEVKKDGGRLAIVLIPSYWQVDPYFVAQLKQQSPHIDLNQPSRFIEEHTHDIPVLDLAPAITQAVASGTPIFLVGGRGHFTETGHALAAKLLQNFLITRVLQL
jgi:hypothetical protein